MTMTSTERFPNVLKLNDYRGKMCAMSNSFPELIYTGVIRFTIQNYLDSHRYVIASKVK